MLSISFRTRVLGFVTFPRKSSTKEVSIEKEMRRESNRDALMGVLDGREERSRIAALTVGMSADAAARIQRRREGLFKRGVRKGSEHTCSERVGDGGR